MTLRNTNPSAPGKNFSTKPKQNSSHEQASWAWNVNHPKTATTTGKAKITELGMCIYWTDNSAVGRRILPWIQEYEGTEPEQEEEAEKGEKSNRWCEAEQSIKQGSFIGKSKGRVRTGLLRDERDARARVPALYTVIYGLAARVIAGFLHQRGTRARVPGLERNPRSGWTGGYIRVRFKKLGVQNTPLCTLFLHSRLFSQTSGNIFFKREPVRFDGYVMSH